MNQTNFVTLTKVGQVTRFGRVGPAKGASLKPAGEHPARTLPLEVGGAASCTEGAPPGHGPLKARHAP